MNKIKIILCFLCCFCLPMLSANSVSVVEKKIPEQLSIFSAKQTQQIQKIIHDYIVNNPRILLEVSKKLQDQEISEQKKQLDKIKNLVLQHKKDIFDPNLPGRALSGNKNGQIIMVVFNQYQCPQCKEAEPIVSKALQYNKDVLFITIYWPFFGGDAIYAAKVALAAQKQNKFEEIDRVLWDFKVFATKDKINEAISYITDIDKKKLYNDIESKENQEAIRDNFALAQKLEIPGSPTFIIANKDLTHIKILPGYTQNFEVDLKKALLETRQTLIKQTKVGVLPTNVGERGI